MSTAPISGVHGALVLLGDQPIDTRHGRFVLHRFHDMALRTPAFVLSRGRIRSSPPLLARVHSSCVTSEFYGGCDCDCAEQLDGALAAIAAEGRGAVFYLMQEGRGAGFAAKACDRMLVQASGNRLTTFEAYEQMGLGRDHRRYDDVVFAARLLGIEAPLRLLTNNGDKIAGLREAGARVAGAVRLRHGASAFNVAYLMAKRDSGHRLRETNEPPAALPDKVRNVRPRALDGAAQITHLASYWLPIGSPPNEAPEWFRLNAYLDTSDGAERTVLSRRSRRRTTPLVRFQEESFVDRFPLRTTGQEKLRWRESAARIVDHGSGAAVFLPPGRSVETDVAVFPLLVANLRAKRVRPIVAREEAVAPIAAGLARAGLEVAEPLVLDCA